MGMSAASADLGLPPPGAVKHDIAEEMGEQALLLPSLVNRALEANDRAKYFLTLLQAAQAHASEPERAFSSLRDERLAAGISDESLDEIVGTSRPAEGDIVVIPGVRDLHDALEDAVRAMLVPLTEDARRDRVDPNRLDALVRAAPGIVDDRVSGSYIRSIASADRSRGDSFHLLVMDAHRALNGLQTEIATETLDGACVYHLEEEDRPLVAAFMAGLRATASLKFDHPGLGTTATRSSRRLLIQNDIGETASHLLVITVEDLAVTVTYTDNHRQRLRFFQDMLVRFPIEWSGTERRRGAIALGEHALVTGCYRASDLASLQSYLQYLGSRLVFLIDWNRARKRLAALVGKNNAVSLLRWAADVDCGHMGFLQLGGERLIYDAVELAAKVPARYGEPLRDVLGPTATLEVVRFALRATAEGVQHGKSHQLIRDELRVELLHHVQAAHARLLESSTEHACLIVETAQALRAALLRLGAPDGDAFLHRVARRAADWEHRADEILSDVRMAARRVDGADILVDLLATADDAIDDLEEALFLLTWLPDAAMGVARPVLDDLAAVVVGAAREHLKAVSIARDVVDGAGPEVLEDFLVAVDQVQTLEHDADNRERLARATLITQVSDFRTLHVADRVCHSMEDATDALMRSALGLRDHILGQMAAS